MNSTKTVSLHRMAQYLTDFPSGPLDRYRKSASFDWKQLKLFLDSEEGIEFENRIYEELQKQPLFLEQNLQTPVLDEIRRTAAQKAFIFKSFEQTLFFEAVFDPLKRLALVNSIYPLEPSVAIKYGLTFGMFYNVVASMGTKRHEHYLKGSMKGDILGCFCLTEIAHGSNTKGMRTTASYDTASKQFILHTPDFEAAKCWTGSLGQTATSAIVFAHLITPDGQKHGLHAFVVDVRNPKTLLPYPGVKICDMGEKIGLNGIDNGFIMFNHYHIPRENLLNKIGDVTEDGKYATPYKDPNKRHGASLGSLSDGRVNITAIGTANIAKAITIAVRYAAVRRQFSADDDEDEVPILEYQSHQHRLLPHLAVAYALKIFCASLYQKYFMFLKMLLEKSKGVDLPDMGLEIHAISSASKPLAGWTVRDAIQECREACAGHGYLKAAGLGDLRNNHDANCTYEGENHILIQQTSNWLLKFWPLVVKGESVRTPLHSIDFLNNAQQILQGKFEANSVGDATKPENILSAFQWLVCYLLKSSYEKHETLLKNVPDSKLPSRTFWAKNNSQVFYAKTLAVVYIQHLVLQAMHAKICEANDPQIKAVLSKLFSLLGMWFLEKHIPILYQGSYATGPNPISSIQDGILQLCVELKDDAVALVDAIAQPDFVLNSVLGYSDGQVYKHLEASMLGQPGALSRPEWWQEIAYWKDYHKAKL